MAKRKTIEHAPTPYETTLIAIEDAARKSPIEAACMAAGPVLEVIEVLQFAIERATKDRLSSYHTLSRKKQKLTESEKREMELIDSLEKGICRVSNRIIADVMRLDKYLTDDVHSSLSLANSTAIEAGGRVAESYTELLFILGVEWVRTLGVVSGNINIFLMPIGKGDGPPLDAIKGDSITNNWGQLLGMVKDDRFINERLIWTNLRMEFLRASKKPMSRAFNPLGGEEQVLRIGKSNYVPPKCPACKMQMKVTSTEPTIRKLKCKQCGFTKTVTRADFNN